MRFVPLALVLGLLAAPAYAAADGATLFAQQCKMCHGPASSPMGPSLAGAAGGKIAVRKDFTYSTALKAKGGTWTDAALDQFLAAPAKFAVGTKMPISVPAPDNRKALVAFLKTLK